MILKLSKRVKTILFILFVVVFLYLVYAYIYQPRNERIQQLDQQITTLQTKIAEGRRIAARLDELKKEYQVLTERLQFVEVLLPKEKEIPEFLVLLQDTMDEFKIDFTNFSPQNLAREQDAIYARLPINMTFTADYFETIKFLDRLENFPRIVDVQDLRVNPGGDNAENINVTMTMFTYVLMKGAR
jgi:Tfp pilus assembly protein PilO